MGRGVVANSESVVPPSLSLPPQGGRERWGARRRNASYVIACRCKMTGDASSHDDATHDRPDCHPGHQQPGPWWAPVPAVLRLLADLWIDAHSQPDARLLLHVGGLFGRHVA